MKKFIRTKDKIYGVFLREISSASYDEKEGVLCIYYSDNRGEYEDDMDRRGYSKDVLYLDDIIRESDDLEELCDDYVFVKKDIDGKIIKYEFVDNSFGYALAYRESYDGIYGGIWTDIGFIFVAKANKEGELELI